MHTHTHTHTHTHINTHQMKRKKGEFEKHKWPETLGFEKQTKRDFTFCFF